MKSFLLASRELKNQGLRINKVNILLVYNIRCSKKKSIIFCMKLNGKIMDFFLLHLIYILCILIFWQ